MRLLCMLAQLPGGEERNRDCYRLLLQLTEVGQNRHSRSGRSEMAAVPRDIRTHARVPACSVYVCVPIFY